MALSAMFLPGILLVGESISLSSHAKMVLDALGQEIVGAEEDRGISYSVAKVANIDASAGSVVDSYDNELAETINGLCKT